MSRSLAISALALGALLSLTLPGPVALARRHPAPTPAPTATPTVPPEDPAVTQIARHEFVSWQAGVVDSKRYAPQTQANLGQARVTEISQKLGTLGSLEKTEWVEPVVVEDMPDVKGYLYKMTCSSGVVYERLILAADGKTIDSVVFMDKLPQ